MPSDKLPKKDPIPKIDWKSEDVQKGKKIFREDLRKMEEKSQGPEVQGRIPEYLRQPHRIIIDKVKLDELNSSGEAVVPHVYLHGRELKPGERVVLVNLINDGDQDAEFVSIEDKGTYRSGAKIKVRLPKPSVD